MPSCSPSCWAPDAAGARRSRSRVSEKRNRLLSESERIAREEQKAREAADVSFAVDNLARGLKGLSDGDMTLRLEQPFAGSKSMTLGFRAMYTNYLWQTWTLFENYDRNLFFPQVIVGLIL